MNSFENHEHWKTVKEVCRRLTEAGHQALLAGGCVRDLLMGREPNDFDVATSATPDQVEGLFEKAVTIGKAFGVTILPFNDFQIEVATFREDLEYKDGRRPEGVKFSDVKADAQRRDFTVNALFFDPNQKEVIDYVGGRKDIEKKIIRTVGDPHLRFDEDKLRLLRAVRFSAQLEFEIENETLEAVIERAQEVSVVSRERIRDELLKLLRTKDRLRGLTLLLTTGLLSGAFKDSAPFIFEEETEWLKRFEALKERNTSDAILLSLFFFPVFSRTGEQDFRERHLKSLRLDNGLVAEIHHLLRSLKSVLDPSKLRRGELADLFLDPKSLHLLELADVIEQSGTQSEIDRDRKKWIEDVIKQAHQQREPHLTGSDLKGRGFAPGPELGLLLREARLLQLEGVLPTRKDALEWLQLQKP